MVGMSFYGLPDIPALAELRRRDQWVAWRYEKRDGRVTKPPISPKSGVYASHGRPSDWGSYEQARTMAVRRSLEGVGFVLTASDGYTAIDLDKCVDANGAIADWAADIVALGETYAEISPSGHGIRMFARGKVEKTAKCDPAHVEIYRDSRYLTVTGNHIEGTPLTIEPAPATLQRLKARIDAMRPTPAPALIKTAPSQTYFTGDFFKNVNQRAIGCLSLWVPSLFGPAARGTNAGGYRISSRDLGRDLQEDLSIDPTGIVDFGVHDMGDAREGKRTPIDLALEYGQGPDAKAAAFWLCAQLGVSPEAMGWEVEPEFDAAEAAEAAERLRFGIEAKEREKRETEALAQAEVAVHLVGGAPDQSDLPDADLHPPGLVGEIADWICTWTDDPIRIHAIGAALVTVGTLIGRKVFTEDNPTGTALYIAALARTGLGKDHPMKCLAMMLDEISGDGMQHIVWNASLPSLNNRLTDRASQVMIVDEFTENLLAMRSRNASTTLSAISGGLRTLWGRANQGSWSADLAATRTPSTVRWPNLSIYGATTDDDWKDALVSKDVTNGLFNRFLILPRYENVECWDRPKGAMTLPGHLVDRLKWLDQCLMDPLQTTLAARGDGHPANPIYIPFSADAAGMNEENKRTAKELLSHGREDRTVALYARLAEQIKRVALIIACGRRPQNVRGAVIGEQDMIFARTLVRWSLDQMVGMVRREMVENQFQAQYKMVLGIIRAGKGRKMPKREITRKVAGRIPRKAYDEILESLVEGGLIGSEFVPTTQKGGRPSAIYWFVRD